MCALNICATLKHNLGDLDKVTKVVKVLGFVNCIDTFTQQPQVVKKKNTGGLVLAGALLVVGSIIGVNLLRKK